VIAAVIRLVEHPGAKMPEQHATEMDAQELLRLYDNGRRDFSDLEFLKYLDLDNVALPQIVLRNCWLDGNFSDSNLEFADFSNSCIKTVNFHRTNLRNANFRGAAIDATEFYDANVDGADFTGAHAHSHTFSAGELPWTLNNPKLSGG